LELIEGLKTRRSIRQYKPDAVPPEAIVEMLEAGRWAPSAGNSQPWSFIVFSDPALKARVTKCFNFGWFLDEAPVGIMVVVDPAGSSCAVQDGSLAAANLMLAAHSLGLGTCWINPGLDDDGAMELLGVPKGKRMICVLSLGYPAESPTKERRKLADIAFIGKFGDRID
jgi:nitroreductase